VLYTAVRIYILGASTCQYHMPEKASRAVRRRWLSAKVSAGATHQVCGAMLSKSNIDFCLGWELVCNFDTKRHTTQWVAPALRCTV
jgi:hypothetical protein